MGWQSFFSPIFLAPFLWLGLLIVSLVWFGVQAFSLKSARPFLARITTPLAMVMALSFPLWLGALTEEIQCHFAGLEINATVEGPSTSVYWASFVPNSDAYPLGRLQSTGPLGKEAMYQLVRALVEGRLSAIEIPFQPAQSGERESTRLNQRFFLAPASGEFGRCVESWPYPKSPPAPGTCVAFETSQGIQSRYEMRGRALISEHGRGASIVDRATGKSLANHRFVKLDPSETLLAVLGIRKLRPMSCTPIMSRIDLSTALIPLVFGTDNAPLVRTEDLASFRASAWKAVAAPPMGEPVPKGADGINYWLQKGAIRQLQEADIYLWNRALMPKDGKPRLTVPKDAYLITGEMRLPDGLSGRHSVKWIVLKNARIPPGPRGGNPFYEVGKGCLWASSGCDR